MEQLELTFRANNQCLEATNFTPPLFVASNTVDWIVAKFDLGTNWDCWSLGAVKAIWKFKGQQYSAILNAEGECTVPHEVLGAMTGEVKVNLVASTIEDDEVIERLTTYPLYCINVNKVALIDGDNSVAITPSEYEQFVEDVQEYAQDAYDAKVGAEQAADSASDSAGIASNMADTATQAKDVAVQQAQLAVEAKNAAQGYAQDAERSASRIESLIPTPTEDGKILVTADGGYEISELVTLTEKDHLYGAENTVTRPEGQSYVVDVIGNNNTLDGSSARDRMFGADVVIGDGNQVKGETILSVIGGHYNDIDGAYAGTIFGTQNKVKVPEGGLNQTFPTIVGGDNEVLPPSGEWYNDVTIVGNANKAGARGQTLLGIYNEPINDIGAIIVGDGTDENARHNAVIIKKTNGEYSAKLNNTEITESKLRELKAVMLPTDTASGTIASFPDGADGIPMSSVKADINPIQDLHGQDSPYPAGGGVNLLFVNSRVDTTIADVIYTSDDDYITLNGTKNGQGYADLSALTITLDAGTYYFRAFNISGSASGTDYALYVFDGTDSLTGSIFTEKSLTLEETKTVRFRFGIFTNGIVFTNFRIGIVVSKTSGISKFAPYSNICPISGWDEVKVVRGGINQWDEEWEQGTINTSTGQDASSSTKIRSVGYIAVLPNTSYYFKKPSVNDYDYLYFYDSSNGFISSQAIAKNTSGTAFTTPNDCHFLRFVVSQETYNNDVSINYPSTDHDYHSYISPLTITTALGQTVYGGTVDVVSGVLTVDRAMVEFDGSNDEDWSMLGSGSASSYCMRIKANNVKQLSTSIVAISNYLPSILGSATWRNYDNFISVISKSTYIFTGMRSITSVPEWKTYLSQNPLQVVYELATPITIQLTPQEVTSLLGGNTVWADSGDVEVTYKADIQRYIDKKISAVLNA